MKQQVTDITEALNGMASEMRSMRETIDAQRTEIHALNRNIESLNYDLRRERQKSKELEERLAKYEKPDRNSGNSSTPPSKEKMKDEIVRRTNSLRKSSGRKPGGQPGHKGHVKEWLADPDAIEEHMSQACAACGRDLSDVEPELDYTDQVVDLPAIGPVITEHRHYMKRCTCGCCNKSYSPRKRGSHVTFGKRIKAIVTYLNIVQCLPYGRLQTLMREMFSVEMSQGTVNNIVREALEKSAPAIKLLEDMLKKSRVVGFDESGCYNNKKLDWAWIAQTAYITLCFRATGRAAKVLEDRFGDSLKDMVAVTDRHSAYFAIDFLGHQVCLAHLLRELEYLSQLDKEQKWAGKMQELFRGAIHERNTRPDDVISKVPWVERLDKLLSESVLHLKEEFERLRKGLVKCRDYIFNFLEDPMIPSDNNSSERGIRKLKVKQKISGTFRSDTGADAFFAIHSIADTAWKNKQSQLEAIATILSL